jgi:hypothetical protein
MSSYFDTMGACFHNPKQLMKLIRKQYASYLSEISDNVIEEDEKKLSDIIEQFYNMERINYPSPESEFGALHSLAHALGEYYIRTKDGRIASDNPWNVPY